MKLHALAWILLESRTKYCIKVVVGLIGGGGGVRGGVEVFQGMTWPKRDRPNLKGGWFDL